MHSKIIDYCNLTGRPVATLTVEEYIRFDKAYSGMMEPSEQKESPQSPIVVHPEPPRETKTTIAKPAQKAPAVNGNNVLSMLKSIQS